MLTLWRRHVKACPHGTKGRLHTKCSCPIWCDGEVNGERVRKSMDTRDWARAMRNLGKIEDPIHGFRPCGQPGCPEMVESGRCKRHTKDMAAAIMAYHEAHRDAAATTQRSRRRTLEHLAEFTQKIGLRTIDEVNLETLNSFRSVRSVSARTWAKELGTVRHFFRFCVDNEWVYRNWATKVAMPNNLKPA